MIKCPHCGSNASKEDNYCGICGYPLRELAFEMSSKVSTYRGIVMTDTLALSLKFGVPRKSVLNVINNYIENVKKYISYALLDVAEKIVTCSPYRTLQKDWTDYHKILYNNHYMMLNESASYLFIIGGTDIIPVPLVRNFRQTKPPIFDNLLTFSID